MTKFYKVKGTELRKAVVTDNTGKPVRFLALIGQVKELLKNNIIFDDNTAGHEEKWLVLNTKGSVVHEFDNLDAAKKAVLLREI